MIAQLAAYIEKHELFATSDKLLVAVSGGIDSVVLLHLIKQLGYEIAIAHCNFQLRASDSDADEASVRALASEYNLPIHVQRFDTKEALEGSGASVQMMARELRYDWFNELCSAHNYARVLVGQHQDDQAETVLLNLIRGTGRIGLGGMLPLHNNVARPLLFASKAALEAFAAANKLAFRTDASNADTKYRRNFIRNKVLPLLSELNPNVAPQLARSAQNMHASNAALNALLTPVLADLQSEQGDRLHINTAKLKLLEPITFYLFELLSPFGFNADALANIEANLDHTKMGVSFFSATHILDVERDALVIYEENHDADFPLDIVVTEDTTNIVLPEHIEFSRHSGKDYQINPDKLIAALDADLLKFPLTIRRWKIGDAFFPLGMNNRKLLSDFFIDNKFSSFQKKHTYLLFSGDDIVWIIGHRIDNRYKITANTSIVFQALTV
jgi:tRNA(Ile)-lysidine synthase